MNSIYRKEKGIVLLTCLIFLLLLLTLLRFVLGSASMQEKKVGADYAQIQASQAASVAMRAAEGYILSQGGSKRATGYTVKYWTDMGGNSNGVIDANKFTYGDKCRQVYNCSGINWKECSGGSGQPLCVNNDPMKKFLIERAKMDPKVIGKKGENDIVETKILLRVTAVGFSDKSMELSSIKQNTYVLLEQKVVPLPQESPNGKE